MTTETTKTAEPTSIHYVVEPCGLGPAATEQDCETYAEALCLALTTRWPDAEIEVKISLHTHGARACAIEMDDGSEGDDVRDAVKAVAERVLCRM